MSNKTRVLIADDHPIVRRGLAQLINADETLTVASEAGDGKSALAQIRDLLPDVAVLDIDMPEMNGFEVARQVGRLQPPVAVIFLTMHSGEDLFTEAMDIGGKGYVLKESAVVEIVAAIKAVSAGQYYITPSLSSYLVNRRSRAEALAVARPGLDHLTPTERRILRLIARSKTSKEIAEELFISYRTVENHRANICQKLELRGSHALLKFALEHKSEI